MVSDEYAAPMSLTDVIDDLGKGRSRMNAILMAAAAITVPEWRKAIEVVTIDVIDDLDLAISDLQRLVEAKRERRRPVPREAMR